MYEQLEEPQAIWTTVGHLLYKTKVPGGYLYQNNNGTNEICMCFVPDVDLERYASHLRYAYNQGFKDGKELKE